MPTMTGSQERRKSGKALSFLAALLTLSLLIFFCLLYIFTCPVSDSDYVEGVFWAEATLNSHKLLSDTFTYGYALPFGANLFMLPFVALFGVGLTANRCGVALFFALLLLALWRLVHGLFGKSARALWCAALILLAFFTKPGLDILNHILQYGISLACSMGILGNLFSWEKEQGRRGYLLRGGLWLLWGSANGALPAGLFALPLFFALLLAALLRPHTEPAPLGEHKSDILRSYALILCGGLAINWLVTRTLTPSYYLQNTLAAPSTWLSRLSHLGKDWLNLFHLGRGAPWYSEALGGALLLLATLLPPLLLLSYKRLNWHCRIFAWLHALASVNGLLCYVLLRDRNYDHMFYFPLLLAFVEAGVWLAGSLPTVSLRRLCALAAVACSLLFGLCQLTADKTPYWQALCSQLEARGLSDGFGTFYQANSLTAASSGAICMRCSYLKDGWWWRCFQTEPRLYETPLSEEFFVLLTEEEYPLFLAQEPALSAMAKEQLIVQDYYNSAPQDATLERNNVSLANYYVLVYDSNCWKDFVCGEKELSW